MRKILILNGHPDKKSFCFTLAENYKKGADSAGMNCKLVNLIDLDFNPILTLGYKKVSELKPDALKVQQEIIAADHLVFVYPNRWTTLPDLLKSYVDRFFFPDFSFKYQEKGPFWDNVLIGKSARLIVTMDTPKWYSWPTNRNTGYNAMKTSVLEFCGIKPVKITFFAPMKSLDNLRRKKCLEEVEKLGELDYKN